MKDEVESDEIKSLVENFIQKNMEGQKYALVTKMYKNKNTYFVSTTSRYCENLKREHGSNHVWFYISGRIIAQKCFCRCETLQGRRDGFCKDFYGRKHELPPSITEKLYSNKEEIKHCPEIKKIVEKPQTNQHDAKELLEKFINRWMKGQTNTKVIHVKKDGANFMVLTTSEFCETINGVHPGSTMSYVIKKKQITQKCPICKKNTSRTHELTPNVLKVLKQ